MLDFLGNFTILVYLFAGIAVGAWLLPAGGRKYLAPAQTLSLFAVLFCLGAGLGAQPDFWTQLSQAGWQSILYALLPIACSVAIAGALARLALRDRPAKRPQPGPFDKPPRRLAALVSLLVAPCSVVLGIACAQTFLSPGTVAVLDEAMSWSLAALILFAGMDIGCTKGLFSRLREIGLGVLVLPLGITLGSLVGGALTALLVGQPLFWGAAVSCGMGFSTLPSVLAGQLGGPALASLVFFSNLLREMLAFLLVPPVARRIGRFACIAPCGATSMDTTLPPVLRATDGQVGLAAALNGVLLTVLVPVLLPLLFSLL